MLQPHYTGLPGQVTCAAVPLVTFAAISAYELARKRVELIVSHFPTFALAPSRASFFHVIIQFNISFRSISVCFNTYT